MHSLVISDNWYVKNRKDQVLNAVFMDFSGRSLILRTKPEEKFAYVWMIFCSGIKFPKSNAAEYKSANEKYYNTHWDKKSIIDDKYSEEELAERSKFYEEKVENVNVEYDSFEKDLLDARFKKLKKVLDKISKMFAQETNGLTVNFDDLTYKIHKDYGYTEISSKSENYPSNGCYDNEGIYVYFNMERALKILNDFLDSDSDDVEKLDIWKIKDTINSMINFAFDENSILIQDTDECDEYDMEKHYKTVIEYVVKNEGRATVIHPIGG